MTITLNVGLKYSDTCWLRGHHMPPSKAIAAIYSVGGNIRHHEEFESNTERTLVASLTKPLTREQLETLSNYLDQDCIAQHDGIEGQLVGPKAEEWGPFNPDYFLTMDGQPLPDLFAL